MDVVKATAIAMETYLAYLGKSVKVNRICGYKGNDSHEVEFAKPLLVRVTQTDRTDVERVLDDWIDPIYNVEPLEDRPEIKGMRSFWIYGESINYKTGERESGDIVSK